MIFEGKCNHCGKYCHKEFQCWAKHGRPNKTEDQVNQAVEDVNDKDEEMVLISWPSGIEEDQDTNDNQDLEQNQKEAQEPEPPRPRSRQAERNQRGGRRAGGRAALVRARIIVWNPRNNGGWDARPGNWDDWTTRLRA